MAFTDFKNRESLKAKFPHIVQKISGFIPKNLENCEFDSFLSDYLEISKMTYRSNEFFASEGFISPILRVVWKKYFTQMNMWTHQAIKYDNDLSGVPDYMFTNLDQEQYDLLSYPIVTTVEAKAENFVEGWAQCAAQMIACQKLNEKDDVVIFGIVTTGKIWEFAKMEDNLITIDNNSYSIEDLQKLMNILNYILAEAAKQLKN
jgi:hypothetical protein